MVYKIIKVNAYRRKGKYVSGHKRKHKFNRGTFKIPKSIRDLNKTIYIRDKYRRFKGRKRVKGRGDFTGVIREKQGRIIGRTKAS